MLSDRFVPCVVCRKAFLFSVQDQLEILRSVPLDDLLDPPGKEMGRWILPPTECRDCEVRLAHRT